MTDGTGDNAPTQSGTERKLIDRDRRSRRSVLRGLGVSGSSLLLSGSALAEKPATPAKDVEVHRDIVFAERDDVEQGIGGHEEDVLQLDLHLPQHRNDHPTPVIVFIHGGAWHHGSKDADYYDEIFKHWSTQGYAIASIEYRLADEAIFPAQVIDVKAAIRWLRAHADEYGLDPDNFGVWGPSAGGHLAALAAVTNGVDEFEIDGPNAEYSSDVQAAVSWFGLFDFLEHGGGFPTESLIGVAPDDDPEAWKATSPVTYLDQDDPPLLLYHGTADSTISANQSELMYERAQELCHDTSLYLLDGVGHGSENFHSVLTDKPPAEATFKTVHCRPSNNAPDQRIKEGPVPSLTDMERFFRQTLR